MSLSPYAAFRISLILYVLSVSAVMASVFVVGLGNVPDTALAYMSWYALQAKSTPAWILGWIGLVAAAVSVICALAMIWFMRWARPVFAVSIVVLLVGELFLELPILKPSFEYFLDSLAGILSGCVVVFSYFSRAADSFAEKA